MTPEQQRIIKKLDEVINHYTNLANRYNSPYDSWVEEFKKGKELALASFRGEVTWTEVPWCVKEMTMEMPDWATRGT